MPREKADVFRGKLEAGRVVVDFAVRDASQNGRPRVTQRVALTREAAERLAMSIEDLLRRLPAVPARAPPDAKELARRGEAPVNAAADEAGQFAARMMDAVRSLSAPLRHERSFRVAPGVLQANRFLLTAALRDISGDAAERTLDVARVCGMPEALAVQAREHFANAGAVHFGFEAGGGAIMAKLYLEQAIAPERAAKAAAAHEKLLQHIAYKWEPAGGKAVVTRYLWHPGLDRDAIEARLAHVYRDCGDGFALGVARNVLDLACSRATAPLQYLEVEEDGNSRRSFDLNTYDAGLRVQDLQAPLAVLRDRYGLRPGQFQALYDQVKVRALGHVAGGTHRDGAEFFNIYHAVS